jgi:hypothetical protein
MPKKILYGFKYPRNGEVLFHSRHLNEPVVGDYSIREEKVAFRLDEHALMHFCNANHIVVGSVLVVLLDCGEEGIVLHVRNVDN